MFVRIAGLLDQSLIDTICTSLAHDAAPWVDGRVTAGHQGVQVKDNQQIEEMSKPAVELGNLIVAELERNSVFMSAVLPHKLYPPMFNRYGKGMQFGTHVDGSVRMIAGTNQKLRTDLSATLFLTPAEAYDGGELTVERDFGNQSVKADAGDLIVYSATSRHRVSAVTRGTRVAAVFWIQSMVRDDRHRELLFELDRTILQLTQSNADPDCLVRLTSHYHGLLRDWADI